MSRERRLEKALTEEKYRCRMVKSKKNWIIKGMLFSTILISGLTIQTNAYADNWTANSPDSIQIEDDATSYTLKEGDTLWAISQVTNIKVETLAEINNIDLASGDQYSLEIGRVIYFDGNHVVVKDSSGNVVADKVLDDSDKVDTSRTFNNQTSDTPKNSVETDSNGNVKTPTNSNQSGKSSSENSKKSGTTNSTTVDKKPTDKPNNKPVNPVSPDKPEVKEFAVTVIYKDEAGNVLGKDADVKVEENKEFTAKAKTFDNFTLVGQPTQTVKVTGNTTITFTYTKNVTPPTPEVEKFDVTIHYVDENGTAIASKEVVKVEKGNKFTATAKTVDGYTLNGQATQEVTVDGNKEITFTYTKNVAPVEKFNVTVNFKDTEGNEIATPETTKDVEKGQPFTATAKEINGYTVQGDTTKTITVNGNEEITFTYIKNVAPVEKFAVTVVYKDTEGNILDTDQEVEVEKGKEFTATAKTIDGYILVGENTQTIIVDKSETIIFIYKKDESPVGVDKTELQNLVNTVKDTDKGNYTDESFNNFKTALDNANSILNKDNAIQQEVNQAKNDLQNAYDNLTENEITVDKSELEQLVNSVKETQQGNYTDESYTNFTTALTNANAVLGNPDATQSEVDTAKTNLQTAFDNLEEKSNGGSLSATEIQIAKATILREVNNLRASYGLEPVISEEHLNRASDVRAIEIETLFDHVRPDGSGIEEAVIEQGAFPGIFGENIASNSAPFTDGEIAGMALFNQWKNSPSHLSLMVTKQMKYIGIGINSSSTGIYGVQLMSVMLYDNDTDEPLYPTTKILNETEQTTIQSIKKEQSDNIIESTENESEEESNELEQTEQTTNDSVESSSETVEQAHKY